MLTRCTRDLRYRYVSRAYARTIDLAPEDINGKPIIEVIVKKGGTRSRVSITWMTGQGRARADLAASSGLRVESHHSLSYMEQEVLRLVIRYAVERG